MLPPTTTVHRTADDALLAKQSALNVYPDCIPASARKLYEALGTTQRRRRQSPLIHIGYAIRLSCVYTRVQQGLLRHGITQLVILGGGRDPLGLWVAMQQQFDCRIVECDHRIPDDDDDDKVQLIRKHLPALSNTTSFRTSNNLSYTLVTCDLNQSDQLEEQLLPALDPQRPTLILSELVLCYLHDGPSVLERIQSHCKEYSYILYEPVEIPTAADHLTVPAHYHRGYGAAFAAKLSRGTSTAISFRPHSFPGSVALLELFPYWKIREPFDEHAALQLHLQSYAVACGSSSNNCRWVHPTRFGMVLECNNKTEYDVASIDTVDESAVRQLFQEAYRELGERYPAVRKMVKTALRTDLRNSTIHEMSAAAIQAYYHAAGGDFVVAHRRGSTVVVGGIGVQRRDKECFEIHRLVVDPDYQRRGVATRLVNAMIRMILRNGGRRVRAVTPHILERANGFYQSQGFTISHESDIGDGLVLRTYEKEVTECELQEQQQQQQE